MVDTGDSRLSVLEKSLAVVSALLLLGAAFLGYKSATISHARDRAQTEVADTNNALASLQKRVGELKDENARLRDQLGVPDPTTDPQASTATVRRTGQLTLAVDKLGRPRLTIGSSVGRWPVGPQLLE